MNTKIAVDVQDLSSTIVMDAMLSEQGQIFRTARGRTAILIGNAALSKLKKQYSLNIEDGIDGTVTLRG